MKQSYEQKDGIGSVVDVDIKGRQIMGYLADFDSLDSHRDIIVPGAFNKTLGERKNEILFLNNHRWHQPHGFFAELTPDAKGLKFVSNPMPNTTYSNDAIELYDKGIINNHSIGFVPIKWDYDEEQETRTLKEIKLFEGSNVTIGANRNTPYLGRKSWTMEEINDQISRIVKCLKTGTLSDQTFKQLEIALNQLQMESYKRGQTDAQKQPEKTPTDLPQNDIATAIQIFTQTL